MQTQLHRRTALTTAALAAFALVAFAIAPQDAPKAATAPAQKPAIQVQYLEIVTPDVDATAKALERLHATTFSAPVAALGNARTAMLAGGGRIGLRAPMRPDEEPVVRPYILVTDIEAAVAAAVEAGAELAHPPFELPGQGTFAIYFLGGVQYGLWQN